MHLLYLTFGENLHNHTQAQFSILSFLAKDNNLTIHIITDQPSFYTNVHDQVHVIAVDEQTLQSWKGPHDFFWRIKIKAIEMICGNHAGQPVLYLDSDTFLFGDLEMIEKAGSENKALMHENEGALSKEKAKTTRIMWSQVMNRTYGGVPILPAHCMWNAGVVFTPNTSNNKENLLALHICDEMCRQGVTRRLIEQFALSVALQHTYGLAAAEPVIGHYWSNKEAWNQVMDALFLEAHFKGYSNTQLVANMKTFDFSQLPVKIKTRNTNLRLKDLTDKMFPAKNISFAGG